MKKLNLFLFGCSFGFISSCSTATFTQTGETFPKYEETLAVFAEYPQDVEYDEIGIITSQYGMFRNDASLI